MRYPHAVGKNYENRNSNFGSKESIKAEDCECYGTAPERYSYPDSGKYYQLENYLVNIMGEEVCDLSNSRDFKVCTDELVAFDIISDTKFTKVYAEGIIS